jgi:hypothetical protein
MVGGHRQQTTKMLLEEMTVGNGNGNGKVPLTEMATVAALITLPMQMPSTADADLMVICVVCVLCEF